MSYDVAFGHNYHQSSATYYGRLEFGKEIIVIETQLIHSLTLIDNDSSAQLSLLLRRYAQLLRQRQFNLVVRYGWKPKWVSF